MKSISSHHGAAHTTTRSSLPVLPNDQDEDRHRDQLHPTAITIVLNGNASAFVTKPQYIPCLQIDQDPRADEGCLPFTALNQGLGMADTIDVARVRPPLQIITSNRALIETMQPGDAVNRTRDWVDAAGNWEDPVSDLLPKLETWNDVSWVFLDDFNARDHEPRISIPAKTKIHAFIHGVDGAFAIYIPQLPLYNVSVSVDDDGEPASAEESMAMAREKTPQLINAIDAAYDVDIIQTVSDDNLFNTDDENKRDINRASFEFIRRLLKSTLLG